MTPPRILHVLAACALTALVLNATAHAGVADGYVDGTVSAASQSYKRVSNEYGDAVYPGHRLTITLSGTADINWKRRWEEDCFILCKRREWIEHNFKTPEQWPVVFQLVDDGGRVQHELVTQAGRVEFTVPSGKAADYNNRMRLVAKFSASTPAMNPAQTQGEFKVRIQVSTAERLRNLPLFLSEASPRQDAAALKKAWLTDPFFIEQNRAALARVLAEYARSVFPASNAANASAHRDLLEYAGDIDPLSTQVGSALAQMYLDQGDAKGAEAELIKLIKTLQQKTAAGAGVGTQIELGQAYLKLASTLGAARGYPDAQARADMSAHYTAAIAIAENSRAPMLAVQAYTGRATVNRERNTLDALKAAEQDFRSARDRLPVRIAGMPIDVAVGGKELLLLDRPDKMDVAWRSIEDGASAPLLLPVPGVVLRPFAVAGDGRVLAATSKTLGWLDVTAAQRKFEPIAQLPSEMAGAYTNGAASLVVLAPGAGAEGFSSMLIVPGQESRPVLFEGMPTSLAVMASGAQRYVVHGMSSPKPGAVPPPPSLVFELRDIGKTADTTVRRIASSNWSSVVRYRISPDGKKVAALVDDAPGPQPKRRLLVWDDASGQIEVLTQAVAPMVFGGFGSPFSMAPAPGMVAFPQSPAPDSMLVDFDFAPAGDQLLMVSQGGQLSTVAASANAPLTALPSDGVTAPGRLVRMGLIAAVGAKQTVVDGEYEGGRIVNVVDWASRKVTRFNADKVIESMLGPVGYVRMPDGKLGSVQTALAPITLRTLRAADATVIADDAWDVKELGMLRPLSGGRYLCATGSNALVRDLVAHTETVVKTLPSAVGPNSEQALCLPHVADDRWTLLTHRGGAVVSAQTYRGAEAVSAASSMPPVPAELIEQEQAAAKRIGQNPQPLSFFVPGAMFGQDASEAFRDGTQFATAFSGAAFQEAQRSPNKMTWTSVPYVMLQQETLKVQYARLPADAIILKILPEPANKIIYQRGLKIFWKPLATDTDGKLLLEYPQGLAPPGPPESQPISWTQIRASLDRSRLLISGLSANRDTGASVAEKRVFRVADDGITSIACDGCAKQAFNAKELLKDNLAPGPIPLMYAPMDSSLDNYVAYGGDHASIYNVSGNALSGALPAKAIVWVGDGQAYFLSGKNELSMIRY